ncbi:complexin-3-like [Gastrophryne carolinensis]
MASYGQVSLRGSGQEFIVLHPLGGSPRSTSPKQSRANFNFARRWSSEEQPRRPAQRQAPRRSSLCTQQKAERAMMREHIREKYNLTKNSEDQRQVREAGGNVQLSRELRAIVYREKPEKPKMPFVPLLSYKSPGLGEPNMAAETLQPAARCLVM